MMEQVTTPSELHNSLPEENARRPGLVRGWLEVLSIPVLLVTGAVLGSLTGFPPMASIGAVGLPLLVASIYLKQSGVRWRELIVGNRITIRAMAGYTVIALVLSSLGAFVVTWSLQTFFQAPLIDASRFLELVEGNPYMYAWYLVPVAWGSAAIGEELLCRGFLLHRLEGLTMTWIAVVLQAAIFSLAHLYQGITGVAAIFVLALVFGSLYIKSGRNLVPLILAHGLIDTWAMTVLFLGRPDLLIGT